MGSTVPKVRSQDADHKSGTGLLQVGVCVRRKAGERNQVNKREIQSVSPQEESVAKMLCAAHHRGKLVDVMAKQLGYDPLTIEAVIGLMVERHWSSWLPSARVALA